MVDRQDCKVFKFNLAIFSTVLTLTNYNKASCPERISVVHQLRYDIGNRLTIAAHENSPDDGSAAAAEAVMYSLNDQLGRRPVLGRHSLCDVGTTSGPHRRMRQAYNTRGTTD